METVSPGYARIKLINAIKLRNSWSYCQKDGFSPRNHGGLGGTLYGFTWKVEPKRPQLILLSGISNFKTKIARGPAGAICKTKQQSHDTPAASMNLESREQYRNMKGVVDQHGTGGIKVRWNEAVLHFKAAHGRRYRWFAVIFMGIPFPDILPGNWKHSWQT